MKIAKEETYLDLSRRELAVVASGAGQVEASASNFYRVICGARAANGKAA